MIQPSPKLIKEKCANLSCAIIVGVIGTSDQLSSFRMRVFMPESKLNILDPVSMSTDSEFIGENIYDYFWFTIPKGQSSFDYQLSVATKGKTT